MYYLMKGFFSWMPKWIGEKYSVLWINFKEDIFTYNEAKEFLGDYTSNYLSEMKNCGVLWVFQKKGKKRIYRLVPPRIYIFSYAYNLNLKWLLQNSYSNLILKIIHVLKNNLRENLLSVGIFGSLARGEAKSDSDLDLFIIVREFKGSVLERTKYLLELKRKEIVEEELKFLRSYSINPRFNFILKTKDELKLNFFTIDISFDMKILYDNAILNNYIGKIQGMVKKRGIKRKYMKNGKFYLDLNIEFGEVFEFESVGFS
ncbi:MAG: nucleotidyltransferase domain-containing protein [Promethearchaeota archaeon]|nr:MAG: nucleotidyltransferase domain-containing protein [Candidatus Lokiarchaeota archaeon]